MPSPEPPPRLPLIELGLLVLVALGALAFQLWVPTTHVSEGDYREVAAAIEQQRAAGDVVLLAPWWTERARLFLPAGLPVVGYLGSDGASLFEHPRIWVLAEPELPRANLSRFEQVFLPQRTPLAAPRRFGKLSLTLYRNGRYRPVRFSAAQAYASAKVYLEGPQGRVDCPFDGVAHRCPGASQRVEPQWHELNFEPRRCLWFHPPGGPARLVAEFPEVPASAALSLEAGIIWEHAPRREPTLTALSLGVDDARTGRALVSLVVPPGLEGVQRAEGGPLTEPGPVRLWVQSNNPEARESCVDLFALGPAEGS